MLDGELGQPSGGFPVEITKKVLKGKSPNFKRPGLTLAPEDLEQKRHEIQRFASSNQIDNEDLCSYLMYPTVFKNYLSEHQKYGPVRTLPTPTFFYGMQPNDQISVEIDPGKILEILCLAISETNEQGMVKVFFELNGQPRTALVEDQNAEARSQKREKVETPDSKRVGAPMPGVVASVLVEAGAEVNKGDLLVTLEAMKMETSIQADIGGTIKRVLVAVGDQVEVKDLLVEFT